MMSTAHSFLFSFFFIIFRFWAVRWIKLAISFSFWAHVNLLYRIVSYRISPCSVQSLLCCCSCCCCDIAYRFSGHALAVWPNYISSGHQPGG